MLGKQGEWSRVGLNGGGLGRVMHGGRTLDLDEMLQLYGSLGWKSVCGRPYNLKGTRGKFFFKVCFSFTASHFMA